MRVVTKAATLAVLISAGAAWAHDGEMIDGPVGERMELMEGIRDNIKIVGDMAKGERPFDPMQAREAIEGMNGAAKKIPAAFEAEEMHPKSEAKPAIWTDWDDFVAKSEALVAATDDPAKAGDLDGLRAAMGGIGKSCKGCHEKFRLKKEE